MRRGFAIAMLAFALVGCDRPVVVRVPVDLAIRTDNVTPACHLNWIDGTLVPHAEAGVAIVENGGRTLPVLWPEGFTAQRVGDVVEVFNQDGELLAQTGRRYRLAGGNDEAGWRGCDDVNPR
jgi:hypothetical protein